MQRRERVLWWMLAGAGVLWMASKTETGQEVIAAILPDWKKRAAPYLPLLHAAEDRYGIPRDLLVRQAYQESRFRQDIITGKVRSTAGAVGIMQIIPRFHPSIDPGDAAADERAALDPARAIDYAGKFMRQLRTQFGNWSLALAAYNAGPGNVTKYKGIPPFQETRDYVAQIIGDVNAAGGRIA